jgi:hypothetical protein
MVGAGHAPDAVRPHASEIMAARLRLVRWQIVEFVVGYYS